jgi:phosphoenolpyruvate carboxylase
MKELPQNLRSLVRQSVALLGQVIQRELGPAKYKRIESLRTEMTGLRNASSTLEFQTLKTRYEELAPLKSEELHEIAHAFTLMLELMNVCENAYRSYRLSLHHGVREEFGKTAQPDAIIYVLTAHPTEARSPQNIAAFHAIQKTLLRLLTTRSPHDDGELEFSEAEKAELLHGLQVAWQAPIVRNRAPTVKDEAEHIYSMLFREDILAGLFDRPANETSLYIRSWVGGDKDGHPGVDEKTLAQSLKLSRQMILRTLHHEFSEIRETLDLLPHQELWKKLMALEKSATRLRVLKVSDAKSVRAFRAAFADFKKSYLQKLGAFHPHIERISHLLYAFPALVVPLELRESSDVLMSPKDKQVKKEKLAIYRMLATIEKYARGGDPRWYARGFIISMASSLEHIQAAAGFQKAVFGRNRLPIIPLFEEAGSLAKADQIITAFVNEPALKEDAVELWDGFLEMMVGYSDSSKEAGVLASRLAISEALPKLEKVCEKAKLTPVFFHGSGGSVDRGGGSIEDQTSWWPRSALRHYKVTVQGEMVERYMATAAIARQQIEKIRQSAARGLERKSVPERNRNLEDFANKVSEQYRSRVTSDEFLRMVEAATPYSYLSYLKIGSRPAKRSAQLSVKGLRAIPWILCWTQTRVLFPTWWGVGTAWENASSDQKKALKESFRNNPVFTSYIKALGFTLAKVELAVFEMYLDQSGLPPEQIEKARRDFSEEFARTLRCHSEISGQKNPLWFRPWLGESIVLRSAMIHPLNLLQILAEQRKDKQLLRLSVTGISSGMLTTG